MIGLYSRHATAWDSARAAPRATRPVEAGWLDRLLALLPAGASVLDLGCGGGVPVARYLVERGCAVTGVDAAPEMIAMGRERWPEQSWCVADMRRLALGRRFDGIVAWDSLFHLSHADQRRMVPVLRAHAAPGAGLLFTTGPAHGVSVGTFAGEALFHASLSGDGYRSLLQAERFAVVAHTVEDPACGGRTVWLARRSE